MMREIKLFFDPEGPREERWTAVASDGTEGTGQDAAEALDEVEWALKQRERSK